MAIETCVYGVLVQDILEHLESVRQALTPDQLREAVHHDMTGNEELFQQVRANPKVRQTSDGKYEYKVIIFDACIFVLRFACLAYLFGHQDISLHLQLQFRIYCCTATLLTPSVTAARIFAVANSDAVCTDLTSHGQKPLAA